jgi:hypothetical protein
MHQPLPGNRPGADAGGLFNSLKLGSADSLQNGLGGFKVGK